MITKSQSGHPGGSLSATDILVCLYRKVMKNNPSDPKDPKRDIFVLSKGHCVPALYAALARYNYFDAKLLEDLRKIGSPLQGHPKKDSVPGIETSTGSLGMGASIGIGMALAARIDKNPRNIYVLLGDGECNEGAIWEAAMSANHFNLDNLSFIVDRNAVQLDGSTEKIMSLEPFASKWESFGWNVIEIDGTSIHELMMAFETSKYLKGKPTVIIAYQIKGEGISFMQHLNKFHGKAPNQEEYSKALVELDKYEQVLIQKAKEQKRI
jgi:transketolase